VAKLTQDGIKNLETRDKAYDLRDDATPGLLVRVQPSGTASFYIQIARGKRKRIGGVKDTKLSDARKLAKQLIGEAAADKKGGNDDITLGDILKKHYRRHVIANNPTGEDIVRDISNNWGHLFNLPVRKVGAKQLRDFEADKLTQDKPISRSSINKYTGQLKTMLNWAADQELITESPIKKHKPLSVDKKPEPRFLSDQERSALLKALRDRDHEKREKRKSNNKWKIARHIDPLPEISEDEYPDHVTPMVLIALFGGLRRSEIFRLEWRDVNFVTGQIAIRKPIGGKKGTATRHVPLTPQVRKALEQWQEQNTNRRAGLVFINPETGGQFQTLKTVWGQLLKRAGITNFRFHDLRHTYASMLAMETGDLYIIKELLGHASVETTQIYAHLADSHKRQAVAATFDDIEGA